MQGLKDRGKHVRCVINGWRDGDFANRLDRAEIPYTLAYTGSLSLRPSARALRATASTLLHLPDARAAVQKDLAQHPPDLVVACNRDPLLVLNPVLEAYPVLFHVHDVPPVTFKNRYFYRPIVARVDAFAAVSCFVRDRLIQLGVPSEKVYVAQNGIAPPLLAAPAEREDPRVPRVGIVGQVGEWKGHDDLAEALVLLSSQGVPFQWEIIGHGDPHYAEGLEARLQSAGIADRVVWRGFVRDADEIYAGLDVVVVPSRVEEAFGLIASEAGIRGIPVVVTRRGGLPEQVIDGKTGFIAEPENPASLAEPLAALLRSADLREQMGQAARAHVTTRFTVERMLEAFEVACAGAVRHHSQDARVTAA